MNAIDDEPSGGGSPCVSISLLLGHNAYQCRVLDVAPRGVFLATEAAPRRHQLVRLKVAFDAGQEVCVHGMIERSAADEDPEPGVAVQFYGLGLRARELWEELVRQWERTRPETEDDEPYECADEDAGDEVEPSEELRLSDMDWDMSSLMPPIEAIDSTDEPEEPEKAPSEAAEPVGDGVTGGSAAGAADGEEPEREREGLDLEVRAPEAADHEPEPERGGPDDERERAPGDVELPPGIAGEPDVEEEVPFDELATRQFDLGLMRDRPLPQKAPAQGGTPSSPAPSSPSAPWAREASLLLRAKGQLPLDDRGPRQPAPRPQARPSRPRGPDRPSPRVGHPARSARRFDGPRLLPPATSGLAPGAQMGHVVYRLRLPSVEALREFATTALGAGGVFIRTDDVRAPGAPAVVVMVHPVNGRQFHLPGCVQPTPPGRPGVAVKFSEVTSRTMANFHLFVRTGRPSQPPSPGLPPASPSISSPAASGTDSLAKGQEEELTLVEDSAAEDAPSVLDENTQEFRLSDLTALIDSVPPEEPGAAGGPSAEPPKGNPFTGEDPF